MHIYPAHHFDVLSHDQPHVARGDGGHLVINPKVAVVDRTQLTRAQAIELVKLTMVCARSDEDRADAQGHRHRAH